MSNLTFTIVYVVATLAMLSIIGLAAFLTVTHSGLWLFLLLFLQLVQYPTRIDPLEKLTDKEITEAVSRVLERNPTGYRIKVDK